MIFAVHANIKHTFPVFGICIRRNGMSASIEGSHFNFISRLLQLYDGDENGGLMEIHNSQKHMMVVVEPLV